MLRERELEMRENEILLSNSLKNLQQKNEKLKKELE